MAEPTFKHSDNYLYTEAQARARIHKLRNPNYSECVPYESGVVLTDAQWKAKTEMMLVWADALEIALDVFLGEPAHAPA
jgi:hypothetical protein